MSLTSIGVARRIVDGLFFTQDNIVRVFTAKTVIIIIITILSRFYWMEKTSP